MRRTKDDYLEFLRDENQEVNVKSKSIFELVCGKKELLLEMAKSGEPKPHSKKTKLGMSLVSYMNKNSKCYDEKFTNKIKKLRPDWFDYAESKKQKLIKIAKNGEDRPNSKKTRLGDALGRYIKISGSCYDVEFDKKIRKLAPHWFVSRSDKVNQNKQQLLEMAKNGEDKPSRKAKLGIVLNNYISKNSKCYDEKFTNKIKKLRSEWFITKSDIANQKKQQLLEMAKNGKPKPLTTTKIGMLFNNYKTENSSSYDHVFIKKIRKLRPDWLSSADFKKQQLLEMAKNGEDKPSRKVKLGIVLYEYTNENRKSYDVKFTKKIKKLRPEWFINQSDIANQKKQRLLEMAKNGKPKPSTKNKLGGGLYYSYINKNSKCYDEKFTNKISKLRPDWIVTQYEIANQKKQQLLEMAKNGETKPLTTAKIGMSLFLYTNKKRRTYDGVFTKEIKKLRPDWFLLSSEFIKNHFLEVAKNGDPRPKTTDKFYPSFISYKNVKCESYDEKFTNKIKKLRSEWFITKSDIANQKKQQLLEMAKNGETKPKCPINLGLSLSSYTNKNSGCYDEKFDKKIRKLRPDWLSSADFKKQQLLEMAKNGETKPLTRTKIGMSLFLYTNKKRGTYDGVFTKKIKKLRPDWFRKKK